MSKYLGGMPLTKAAIAFALKKHDGQFRKVSGLPYIVHVLDVFSIVRKYKDSNSIDELCAAAILHDTIEDTDTTYEELLELFGKTVADLVREVTNDPVRKRELGKQVYIEEKLAQLSSWALVIKLADILSNVGENPAPKAIKRIRHHHDFIRSIEFPRTLSATQNAILGEIDRTLRELHAA